MCLLYRKENIPMHEKNNFPMNIGLSSILLIFVALCLVSFSVLSIVSANADKKLSQKVLMRSLNYYEACNQAEEMLCDVDGILHQAYSSSNNAESYRSLTASISRYYAYPISDSQELQITLDFPYPDTSNSALYRILSWKVVTTQEMQYDEQLHVIP